MIDTTEMNAKLFKLCQDELHKRLSQRDQEFLYNITDSIRRWGWTDNRAKCINEMYERATAPKPEGLRLRSVEGIVELFERAGARLQRPSITMKPEGLDIMIRIAIASDKSRFPGSITITSAERGWDGRRAYYGRIVDGVWQRSQTARLNDPNDRIGAFLILFAAKPAEMAAAWGKLSGHCCFCAKALGGESRSAKRSVAAGFGEVCAKHWGLHELWKKAADENENALAA